MNSTALYILPLFAQINIHNQCSKQSLYVMNLSVLGWPILMGGSM